MHTVYTAQNWESFIVWSSLMMWRGPWFLCSCHLSLNWMRPRDKLTPISMRGMKILLCCCLRHGYCMQVVCMWLLYGGYIYIWIYLWICMGSCAWSVLIDIHITSHHTIDTSHDIHILVHIYNRTRWHYASEERNMEVGSGKSLLAWQVPALFCMY